MTSFNELSKGKKAVLYKLPCLGAGVGLVAKRLWVRFRPVLSFFLLTSSVSKFLLSVEHPSKALEELHLSSVMEIWNLSIKMEAKLCYQGQFQALKKRGLRKRCPPNLNWPPNQMSANLKVRQFKIPPRPRSIQSENFSFSSRLKFFCRWLSWLQSKHFCLPLHFKHDGLVRVKGETFVGVGGGGGSTGTDLPRVCLRR